MSARIKGWCPSAHRPMMSGDGLLVRVHPKMARLEADQMRALCDLARRFGNGMIDVTSRANLQIRGVREADHGDLLAALIAAKLVMADPAQEALGMTITPFWRDGDLCARLGAALAGIEIPPLPDKMGVVIDTAEAPFLGDTPGDFRFELTKEGVLMLRADGAERGRLIEEDQAGAALGEMARWFLETGGAQSGRMARHLKTATLPDAWTVALPRMCGDNPTPGLTAQGPLFGVPFGQTDADALEDLLRRTQATHLRITPWRMVLAEGGKIAEVPGFLSCPDPLLNVSACPGAPACAQASVETRALARKCKPHTNATLHVSGCTKGCASRGRADITLVGRNGRFDLVKNGRPGDTPDQSGLSEADILNHMAHLNAL